MGLCNLARDSLWCGEVLGSLVQETTGRSSGSPFHYWQTQTGTPFRLARRGGMFSPHTPDQSTCCDTCTCHVVAALSCSRDRCHAIERTRRNLVPRHDHYDRAYTCLQSSPTGGCPFLWPSTEHNKVSTCCNVGAQRRCDGPVAATVNPPNLVGERTICNDC